MIYASADPEKSTKNVTGNNLEAILKKTTRLGAGRDDKIGGKVVEVAIGIDSERNAILDHDFPHSAAGWLVDLELKLRVLPPKRDILSNRLGDIQFNPRFFVPDIEAFAVWDRRTVFQSRRRQSREGSIFSWREISNRRRTLAIEIFRSPSVEKGIETGFACDRTSWSEPVLRPPNETVPSRWSMDLRSSIRLDRQSTQRGREVRTVRGAKP